MNCKPETIELGREVEFMHRLLTSVDNVARTSEMWVRTYKRETRKYFTYISVANFSDYLPYYIHRYSIHKVSYNRLIKELAGVERVAYIHIF